MAGDQALGVIVRGSLSKGLELKLNPTVSLEELRAGMFAVAQGEKYHFVSLITDLELTATTEEALQTPEPPDKESLLGQVLIGDSLYARAVLRPHLMVDPHATTLEEGRLPVKTIPGHFTHVRKATSEDVDRVFGAEGGAHFRIGTPLEMDEIPVCVDLNRFAERSNGIFGKSGTGKTFLTRVVLSGLVSCKEANAVNLVFDMHSEYGYQGTDESAEGGKTKGLRQLFGPNRVKVYTLDPRPSAQSDHEIRIPYSFLTPGDVLGLQKVLNLRETAVDNAYVLQRQFGKQWFASALEMDTADIAEKEQAHEGSLRAFRQRLVRLQQTCEAFLVPDGDKIDDPIPKIIQDLQAGIHVVIDFGRYNQLTHYLLVANLLTRRIDEHWRQSTEEHLAKPDKNPKPRRLVITIEEAHKFLEPGIADQTIFGRIARELRKYNVTLLIVDQRPSQIDPEVLSQLGTKICCLLDDEKDVHAVLAGASGSAGLRSVLASLDTRQQALIFGHALPMPVVVKTRTYNQQFWQEMGHLNEEDRRAKGERDHDELYG